MLDLKVRRIGNSLGVVLPKEALALCSGQVILATFLDLRQYFNPH